ncbi:hypothetical protein GCM10027093_26960 [Paraburkholderia jirisanensis]
MSEQVIAVRSMLDWAEQTLTEFNDAMKAANATVTYRYEGGLEGKSTVGYSLLYLSAAKALFAGYEVVSIEGGALQGTLVLRHDGVFENGVAQINAQLVAAASTGSVAAAAVAVRIEADQQDPMKSRLIIELTGA